MLSNWLGFIWCVLVLCMSACAPTPSTPATRSTAEATKATGLELARQAMVDEQIRARDVRDPRVLQAMQTVPRHAFVPESLVDQAYADHPLPIGHGQTISQPYIVAVMTELAQIQPGDRVLEIGAGSGYQAAILAMMTDQVYTIEIIPALAESADERLKRLGYTNVTLKNDDGYNGWQEHAPFDAILVTAAPDHVPPPLIGQLKDGGRIVVPVGPPGGYQTLWRVIKRGGQVVSENIMGVLFVPLTRK